MLKKIFVDVGCRRNPWPFEVQGKDEQGNTIFYYEFREGSNNIWEYLAIYYWLQYAYEVWTDSLCAMCWVKKGCKTRMTVDPIVLSEIKCADDFFRSEFWIMNRIKLWDTPNMWENPADFWRK
jgi:hypothetical protein